MAHVGANIPEDVIVSMNEPLTALEVQAAHFQMASTKAPDPDGLNALFCQNFQPCVKNEISKKIVDVLNSGHVEDGVNDTIITLIPKVKSASRICCNVPTHCKVCDYQVESSKHVLLHCWRARVFWSGLNIQPSFVPLDFAYVADQIGYYVEKYKRDFLALICYGTWMMWFNRNRQAHD